MSFYKHYIFTRNSHLKRRKLLYEWNLRTYVQGPWALKESKINTVLMVRGGLKKETFLYFPHFHSLFFNRKFMQFGNYSMVTAHLWNALVLLGSVLALSTFLRGWGKHLEDSRGPEEPQNISRVFRNTHFSLKAGGVDRKLDVRAWLSPKWSGNSTHLAWRDVMSFVLCQTLLL